jgi:hypothetical protein
VWESVPACTCAYRRKARAAASQSTAFTGLYEACTRHGCETTQSSRLTNQRVRQRLYLAPVNMWPEPKKTLGDALEAGAGHMLVCLYIEP